ncbi:Hypothetical protein NTJ_00184 [Nesidiocoris tenuis]|uniref:Uncharacterized protein n=1 Tax=Nesidiocoris tenuis TaxID=355587 RepID=A0ABN7A813_9HEMI|nr:Hypothetical protein NTJ_00184 [Nesidiocoris tenuis]
MCYEAEVWGYQKSPKVDQAQIVCLRKIFGLHTTSPHYLIYMETGRRSLSTRTLQQHGNYVLKTLALQDERLPNIITKELCAGGGVGLRFGGRKWIGCRSTSTSLTGDRRSRKAGNKFQWPEQQRRKALGCRGRGGRFIMHTTRRFLSRVRPRDT